MDVEMQERVKDCVASGVNAPEKEKMLVRNARLLFKADQAFRKKIALWNRRKPCGTIRQFLAWLELE